MSQWEMFQHYIEAFKPVRTPDDPLVDANDIAMPEDEVEFWRSQPRDEEGRWTDGQEDHEGSG